MTKKQYESVADIINSHLRTNDNPENGYKPRIEIHDTKNHGFGFDKWSLFVNNNALWLFEQPGFLQNLLYADNTYTVGDDDLYIEPISGRYFGLAVL